MNKIELGTFIDEYLIPEFESIFVDGKTRGEFINIVCNAESNYLKNNTENKK